MLLRPLLAALLMLAPAPVATATEQVAIPADTAARAKFPNDKPETIDALAHFNKMVNGSITYVTDREHYGVTDHYVSLPPDGKGDCEDFALSKLELLQSIGFPVISNAKLVFLIVHVGKQSYGHAIVAIKLPSGDVAYLDMGGEPMTRKELEAKGYVFFDW